MIFNLPTKNIFSAVKTMIAALGSDDIANNSENVTGDTVTDAIDALATDVSGLDTDLDNLSDDVDNKVLYYDSVAVSAATSAQIMRIPSSGTDDSITTDTVVLECYFADVAYIMSDVEWTSYEGYIAFTGTCSGATTADVVLGTKGN